MFCSGPKTYHVSNTVGAEVGDSVTIAIAAGSVRKTANLAYILPLTATLAGAAFGASFGDGAAIAGGGAGLVLSFLYIRFRAQGLGKLAECPHIISRS
jgi:sigma-E factor negative regulatory protein RseC